MDLAAEQREADQAIELCQWVIGCGEEGLVSVEDYEEAMEISRQLKEDGLAIAGKELARSRELEGGQIGED